MKKVLILGSKGTLGQELVKEFSAPLYEVYGWDRGELDVTSPEAKNKIIALHPEIIINSTGHNEVDKIEADLDTRKLAYALNADAPKILAETAKEIDAIFVNYSTDFVFKGDAGELYKEDDLPNPRTAYGQTKYEGEKKIRAVGGRYYIIRPSRIFGRPGIGVLSKKSFVDVMRAKANDLEVKVNNDECGSPTYATDLARFTKMLIEQNYPVGIYHGVNSGVCSWYEWAKEIFKLLNSEVKVIPVSGKELKRAVERPAFTGLANTKTPPQRSWQAALSEYLTSKIWNY